jgi:hypothetical protein
MILNLLLQFGRGKHIQEENMLSLLSSKLQSFLDEKHFASWSQPQ